MAEKAKNNMSLSVKNIQKYIYLFIYLIFLAAFVYIGFFLKKNIYDVINKQEAIVQSRLSQSSQSEFGVSQFNKLIKDIDKVSQDIESKKEIYKIKVQRNIF